MLIRIKIVPHKRISRYYFPLSVQNILNRIK